MSTFSDWHGARRRDHWRCLLQRTRDEDRASMPAVRIGMKHRVHDRLQIASGDLLSDGVGDRRNAQRSRPTIRLWNIDPPHWRGKVAP